MGWFDQITGQAAAERVDRASAEMERVCAALATRVLDLHERLHRLEAENDGYRKRLRDQQDALDVRLRNIEQKVGVTGDHPLHGDRRSERAGAPPRAVRLSSWWARALLFSLFVLSLAGALLAAVS